MNQGKLIVGIAVLLGICAGLGGYWWNYGVSRRAMEFWGPENARLIRLAPKIEYLKFQDGNSNLFRFHNPQGTLWFEPPVDLSLARGLIHLRNAILSDDQYHWPAEGLVTPYKPTIALQFTDANGARTVICFDLMNMLAFELEGTKQVQLGPLAKSLEQFLARELPRAEQDATAKQGDKHPVPAKSE